MSIYIAGNFFARVGVGVSLKRSIACENFIFSRLDSIFGRIAFETIVRTRR